MPKVLLGKGARGELVRRVQLALADQAFDPGGADGSYGRLTESAVAALQKARTLDVTGAVDPATWTALLGVAVPSVQDRALQLTAAFEGHGFTLAQGNWDGAGITWGVIGFTLKDGELSRIVLQIFDERPDLVRQAFSTQCDELIDIMRSPRAVQMKFANRISLGTSKIQVAEPWRSKFAAFGRIPEVQSLQLALADADYGQPSLATAARFSLTTELGRALAFDIHVQNGGLKPSAEQEINAAFADHPIATELERRIIIANVVADVSSQFKEDVRARKLTIATGTGKVHGELFVVRNWGLDETPAADTA